MAYKLLPFSDSINLEEFYSEAERRGFKNNSNRKMLIDSIASEREWQVWILYHDDIIVGTTAAHSFDEMGNNSYRIAVRSCAFSDRIPHKGIRTRNGIINLQHLSPQLYMTTGIEWAGKDKDFFITTNENESGTQQRVHRIWAPTLEKTGVLSKDCELFYRNTEQTVWRVNVKEFYKQLKQYGQWSVEKFFN